MFMVHVRVEPGTHMPPPQGADAAALRRQVLARALPADGLQHVHVRADGEPAGVDLILFIARPGVWAAEAAARRLVQECLRPTPGWTLARCGVTLPGALAAVLLQEEGKRLPRQPPDAGEC